MKKQLPFLGYLFVITVSILPWRAVAQYPALTRVISFNKLKENAVDRKMHWTNPDSTDEEMTIVEMAIPVDADMIRRTIEFEHANYDLNSAWLNPHAIVFHAMGDGGLQNSLEVSSFLNDQVPATWGSLHKAGKLPNGAHFIIDRDGRIICLAPPQAINSSGVSYERTNHRWIIKRHQDGNPLAIGIENVTAQGDWTDLTTEQMDANAKLARWLIWLENGNIEFLTSHHQFNSDDFADRFLTHFKLKHLQPRYRTRGRKDIGDKNLQEIVHIVNDRNWKCRVFK